VTDPATVQAAALDLSRSLVHDLFGADLAAAIVRRATDRDLFFDLFTLAGPPRSFTGPWL
jgi:hypothetical protein